ncbi:MAG: DUF5107 domain-containing protein [Chloroflexi bacterium]|nr:DUF5107 domain-containing protein [Chloroflexota bacterium]
MVDRMTAQQALVSTLLALGLVAGVTTASHITAQARPAPPASAASFQEMTTPASADEPLRADYSAIGRAALVNVTTATISLPTYPYEHCLETRYSGLYPYGWLSWTCYGDPQPQSREYELVVLENTYLRVSLMPELGGRIYELTFKPTGHNELYANPVIKPTRWGPTEQGWWLAAGGIEWCLPVEEHGYYWGTPWDTQIATTSEGVTVTLQNTPATNRLRAQIAVHLPADRAILAITPRIDNPTASALPIKFWSNAMIAPGAANTVAADLHFINNAPQVTVHSSANFSEGEVLDWPVHRGQNLSRLGNWDGWLGFFERPAAARIGFVGVYDTAADEGLVRVFPPEIAHGAKGFGMGWKRPIDANLWTDDGSTYVEIHGGIAPTYDDHVVIGAGQALTWTEYWYPVSGIGWVSAATDHGALDVRRAGEEFHIALQPTRRYTPGEIGIYVFERATCRTLAHQTDFEVAPDSPHTASVSADGLELGQIGVTVVDTEEQSLLMAFQAAGCLPPTARVHRLPPFVETATFTPTWSGIDPETTVVAFDIQVRDGVEAAWSDWLTATTAHQHPFTGVSGHTYFFRARGQNGAGRWGEYDDELWGQAFTSVLIEPAPVLITSRKAMDPTRFYAGQTILCTVHISNTGSATATVDLTDALPPELHTLTHTASCSLIDATLRVDTGETRCSGRLGPGNEAAMTFVMTATTGLPLGASFTNTVEISGSVLGPFTRTATVSQHLPLWLPLILRP